MFTVKDFLELPQLEWYRLVSGQTVVGKNRIDYISRVETPVDDFVRENELALSTAIGLRENQHALLNFVRGVANCRASALALSTPDDKFTWPETVVSLAERENLPLIILPWNWHFSEIIEIVSGKIRENALGRISFYEGAQREILTAYLQNETLGQAAVILGRIFNCQVAVLDTDRRVKGAGEAFDPAGAGAVEIPIATDSQLYGYLIFQGLAGSGYTTEESAYVEKYVNSILILWFDREWTIKATRQSVKDDFVWKLAKGEATVDPQTLTQAEFLGFNLELPYTCLVGKITHVALENKVAEKKWIADHINAIKEETLEVARSMGLALMLTYQLEVMIIYLQNSARRPAEQVHTFLDQLEEKMRHIFPTISLAWGLSEITTEAPDFARYYVNAKLSQELCSHSRAGKNRYAYEDTMMFSILAYLAENHKIKSFTHKALVPILDYDQINRADLLKTLKIYLQSRNVSQTARRLGIHRQTLIYRLEKIESLSKFSLKDHNDSFFLELCVRLYLDFS